MEPEKEEPTRPIIDQLKEYAETRFKLLKYEVIERSTSIIADVITDLAIIVVLVLTFLFASFTLALFMADVLHSYWQGFACVTVLYALIATIIAFAKRSFERPIINAMVRKFFK
ncbi:phage holin family protein [Mucilaginibacter rigui]|uniref:Phage holin family protein n=1 Tax=Mucilaginibacter rigui TaxID=534635 RepID=A0ABR7X3D7_9SPHI|nr:phage holin family protein [Mucilaginibacter rigui]MBD1385102.1 phage holin family protein [Mucilaginibacter rigui]